MSKIYKNVSDILLFSEDAYKNSIERNLNYQVVNTYYFLNTILL